MNAIVRFFLPVLLTIAPHANAGFICGVYVKPSNVSHAVRGTTVDEVLEDVRREGLKAKICTDGMSHVYVTAVVILGQEPEALLIRH